MRDTKNIDVSIVMPVYNHEKYIRQALESILEQETEYMYEILIGEDASTDNSKDIIKEFEEKYPGRIHAFYHRKNLGGTRNGYELYMAACGRYIAVLEGDDYWTDKHKIQKQVSFLDAHLEYIGCASNFSIINEDGEITEWQKISDEHLERKFTWQDFLERGFEFQTATLIYRNIYLDGKDYTILYKAHELVGDLTMLTILLNQSNIYIMKDIMSAYRQIIDVTKTNACSIAKKDMALASLKTVKQYVMLRPYLKSVKDFNHRISEQKFLFIKEMAVGREGYTWERWKELRCLGDTSTNLSIVIIFFEACLQKLKGKVRKMTGAEM